MDVENLPGYQAALEAATFFVQSTAGYVRVSGADQTAFLQRQTSNDLKLLEPGQPLLNVLTSPTARILDVLYLLQSSDEGGEAMIDAITLPGRGAETSGFLKSRIFFMDQVAVRDISAEIAQIDLIGPQASAVLQKAGAAQIPTANTIVATTIQEISLRILNPEPAFGLGYRLLVTQKGSEKLLQGLAEAGATPLAAESYLILRVEAGLPEADYELTSEYTPLETGLELTVSDNKGCYTGQEILARQVTYDKVTQRLCGLYLEEPRNSGERVWFEGKSVGTLTSSVRSPRFGAIGLAILKRPHHTPGTALRVGVQPEDSVPAVVTTLPFKARS